MTTIAEKISCHTAELVNILMILKTRLDDANIESDKEMKYLRFMISAYYKIKEKVEKRLVKSPVYYVNSDDDTESECDIDETVEVPRFKERLEKLITEGTEELLNLEHFSGLIHIEKYYSS
jgi:hypothetical protein